VGDVNADGFDDLLVVGPRANEAWLVYGRPAWSEPLSVADESFRVFRLRGPRKSLPQFDEVIRIAGSAGDLNADGRPDLLISSTSRIVRLGIHTGAVYVLFGGDHLVGEASVDEIGSPELPGLVFHGEGPRYSFGDAIDGGGDFNGDGISDVLLASRYNGGVSLLPYEVRSSVFVVLGSEDIGRRLELTHVTPGTGPIGGAQLVTLFGTGFTGAERVFFGEGEAEVVEVVSRAELRVRTPEGAESGAVDVEVRRPDASSTLEEAYRYDERARLDLVLDSERLLESGFRSTVIVPTVWPPPQFNTRQFLNLSAGDLDGDGKDDLAVGETTGGDERLGQLTLFWGRSNWPGLITVNALEEHGTVIDPPPGTIDLGSRFRVGGDLDGDGRNDLLIGSVR